MLNAVRTAAVVLLATAAGLVAQEKKEPLAVMDLQAKGVDQTTASILSDELRTELFGQGNYNVLNREDMKAILGEYQFQQSGMCDDTKCMAQIGGALGVVFLVTGSIGKLGDTYSISLKMIDIEKMENVKMINEKYSGNEKGLFTAVQNAGRKLLGRTELLIYAAAPAGGGKQLDCGTIRLERSWLTGAYYYCGDVEMGKPYFFYRIKKEFRNQMINVPASGAYLDRAQRSGTVTLVFAGTSMACLFYGIIFKAVFTGSDHPGFATAGTTLIIAGAASAALCYFPRASFFNNLHKAVTVYNEK